MWLSELRTWLMSLRMQVWSLALITGLRIWYCYKLKCRLQMQLGSCTAVMRSRPPAAAPIWLLTWEIPYATGVALKRKKERKKKKGCITWKEKALRLWVLELPFPCQLHRSGVYEKPGHGFLNLKFEVFFNKNWNHLNF